MNRILILILVFSAKLNCNAQEIEQLQLEIRFSFLFDKPIQIKIYRKLDEVQVFSHSYKWTVTDSSKFWKEQNEEFSSGINEFNGVVKLFPKLDENNLRKEEETNGFDGNTTTLTFGNESEMKSFTIWSPKYSMTQRKLYTFCKICESIADIAKVDISYYWN